MKISINATLIKSPSVLLVVLFFFAVACKDKKNIQVKEVEIFEGSYVLNTLSGAAINTDDYMRGKPTIVFLDSTSLSGSTGCNQYRASYSIQDSSITIKMGPMTKMACPGRGEQLFLDALSSINTVRKTEESLVFLSDAKPILSFGRTE